MNKIRNIQITFYFVFLEIKTLVKPIVYARTNWLEKIYNLSYKKIISFYLVLFGLGRILLFYNPIRYDIIHQIFLTVISFLVIYSLKYAYAQANEIQKVSAGLVAQVEDEKNICTSKTLKTFADQMIIAQQSVWWLIIMLIPPLRFIRQNIYLGFIERTPSGYYAVIFAASTYYLALLGYVQIGIAIFQFYRISHDKDGCIPVDFPHDTVSPPEWLSLWDQLFNKIVRKFFLVGTLFTLEYVLLMPKDVVNIKDNKFTFNVRDVNSFLFSWGTIFVFIVIALPLINMFINKMKLSAIHNLERKIKREYEILLGDKLSTSSPLDIWVYRQLINNTLNYSDDFHFTQSIVPIISTLFSLILNGIKLYESVLSQFIKT